MRSGTLPPGVSFLDDNGTYVDKYGKSVIQVGQFKDCHKLSDRISALTRISVSECFIRSRILYYPIVSKQLC